MSVVTFYYIRYEDADDCQFYDDAAFTRKSDTDFIIKTISQGEPVKTSKLSAASRVVAADKDADTFDGTIIDGYPDGYGRYTFKKRRRIDMHDEKERWAEAGDYIDGTWNHGHLNYGDWRSADGTPKEYITLGDNPDYKLDQQLGKCVKP